MNMTNYTKTHHCETRMNQRGISDHLINLLFEFGESDYHDGAEVTVVPKSTISRLRHETNISNQELDKLSKTYVVENDGKILTTGKRFRRFKRNA